MSKDTVKLDTRELAKLITRLNSMKDEVVFGVTKESKRTYDENPDIDTAQVGAIHEYGWGPHAERAWLRRAASKENGKEALKKAVPEIKRFTEGKAGTDKDFMEVIRYELEKVAKDSIREDTLIDTRNLINTVVGEIRPKKDRSQ